MTLTADTITDEQIAQLKSDAYAAGNGRTVSLCMAAENEENGIGRAARGLCAEIGEAGGGSWSRADRPRVDTHPTQAKLRWEAA